ncbi:hypothetical protein CVT26_010152 [Gymnopilus dilepis]|uniref:BTB domain-containing protein n=1 Tax=Gymnopilus dilepis TaxID=231916 RepID=A0A409YS23_9AGAR|nr:hypothetical protein CVT26_010152 [Gymnopilus dilepis]
MENAERPSAKRRRSDAAGPGGDASSTPTRSSDYWFDSGDVVLEAEGVQFRVHRDVLARHSRIFSDTFGMPQGEGSPQDVLVDDCPIVGLSEKSSEIKYLLSIFYDNMKAHDWRKRLPISHISILLRLGKKYEIDYLVEEARKRLLADHPAKLSEWDGMLPRQYKEIEQGNVDPCIEVIVLGHEQGLESILPSAYLRLAHAYTLEAILEFRFPSQLRLAFRVNCAVGREAIITEAEDRRKSWFSEINKLLPTTGCTALSRHMYSSPSPCPTSHSQTAENFPLWSKATFHSDVNKFAPLTEVYLKGLCPVCAKAVKAKYDGIRSEMWQRLPTYFRLGTWESLKDFTI